MGIDARTWASRGSTATRCNDGEEDSNRILVSLLSKRGMLVIPDYPKRRPCMRLRF